MTSDEMQKSKKLMCNVRALLKSKFSFCNIQNTIISVSKASEEKLQINIFQHEDPNFISLWLQWYLYVHNIASHNVPNPYIEKWAKITIWSINPL